MKDITGLTKECGSRMGGINNMCFLLCVKYLILMKFKQTPSAQGDKTLETILTSNPSESALFYYWCKTFAPGLPAGIVDTERDREALEQLANALNIQFWIYSAVTVNGRIYATEPDIIGCNPYGRLQFVNYNNVHFGAIDLNVDISKLPDIQYIQQQNQHVVQHSEFEMAKAISLSLKTAEDEARARSQKAREARAARVRSQLLDARNEFEMAKAISLSLKTAEDEARARSQMTDARNNFDSEFARVLCLNVRENPAAAAAERRAIAAAARGNPALAAALARK